MEEITGMNLNSNVIKMYTGIPEYITAEEIKHTTQADDCLNALFGVIHS